MLSVLTAAGLTVMPVSEPGRPLGSSATVIDWVPAESSVTLKVWTPWSAAVNV